ncbi:hypothetical protein V5O48_008196 [Marasmius crinis-equi]|uniref:BTB domain-containing protein n=1 Tax=Marasmius crinis-equi TaxID=585013 RepID=A0ABR3FF09_9AGAR
MDPAKTLVTVKVQKNQPWEYESLTTSPLPASLQECTQVSLKSWQDDLARLFHNAKDRFPDVVWEVGEEDEDDGDASPDIEEIWGHKAIVYARAPPSFQTRYFQFRPANNTSLSLGLSDSYSRSPSPSRNPTPQPTGQGITRLRTVISTALFSNELEYLYTGQGFGEAFQFLFDEEGAAGIGGAGEMDSEEMRVDKLRRDLVFMWRSRLYSDVKIALSNEHEPSTAVFSTHKFILVTRSSYFAKLLSASAPNSSKEESQVLTLPSPPHTPASLHFTLGYLYTGTLSFSHRTYDLSTALSILLTSSPSYLNLPSLHAEIRSRIVIEMAHGLFHAFLPFAEYDSLLNRGGLGGCKCRQCARRIPRILSFALQPNLQDSILERGARRALVGLFGDGWCTPEFAELDVKIRESVIRGVKKRMWKEFEEPSAIGVAKGKGLFGLLFAAESALGGKLAQVLGYNANGKHDEVFDDESSIQSRKPWATTVRNDILTARRAIDECLAECVEDCLSLPPSTTASMYIPNAPDLESTSQLGGEDSQQEAEGLNEFHLLLLRSPHTPSYSDAIHLQHILASLLRGLSHTNAPVVYQTLVSNVLLLPSIGDPEQSMREFGALMGERQALLAETNYVRVQVEEARVEVMKWIKSRWRRVRDVGGFLLRGNKIRVPAPKGGDNNSLSPAKGNVDEEREGKMELWAVQEIADYIQIPLDDLLITPITPVSAHPSSQSLHPVKAPKGGDDTASVMSARSGVSARSAAPSFKSGAPSYRSGISTRSGALSPTGRRNGAMSPTGRSVSGSVRSGALSPTRTGALSPTMRVSTLSKNLPSASQKRVVSSASSVRSFRSTTSTSTATTSTRRSARETPAKVDREKLGVSSGSGERPDSKFTEVDDGKVEPPVPNVVVGDVDMQDETSSTSGSTSTSVSPRPSPSKSGQGALTPKASMSSLSSTHSTHSNHSSSARSSSTSISPKQRRGSTHSTASVASTIRRAHAAAAKGAGTGLKVPPSPSKRPVSSASTTTSTTASSVSGEYRTASTASGAISRSTSGNSTNPPTQRKRTTSAGSTRSVSGASIKSVSGASVRSVSSPRVARKSSAASTTTSTTSSRPPSVAASIRSKKEVAPPLPPLKKKGSSDTIKTIGGTLTKATASSAAKATPKAQVSSRKVTTSQTPEEPRDPPPHLNGATLEIGIPCIVHVTLPPMPSMSSMNGSKMAGRKKLKALAKYIGQIEGEDGNWVGVEVPSAALSSSASKASPNPNTDVEMSDSGISLPPVSARKTKNPGWHDGTYQGIRYFALSAPTNSSSNKKEQWGDADETPAGGYYQSSHRKFASAGVGTVRKRFGDSEVGGTVGRHNKRLKTQTAGGTTEKRGLFVRPQQVLYVVDAIDGDDDL